METFKETLAELLSGKILAPGNVLTKYGPAKFRDASDGDCYIVYIRFEDWKLVRRELDRGPKYDFIFRTKDPRIASERIREHLNIIL